MKVCTQVPRTCVHKPSVLSYNYTMRFIGYDSIQTRILSLSNSHSNVATVQKNRGDKSHRVIVALDFHFIFLNRVLET